MPTLTKRKLFQHILSVLLIIGIGLPAQADGYRFRVYLKDKKGTPYSVKKPSEFLSQKAIDRRKKWKLKVDFHDLPVAPAYLDALRAAEARILCVSKWNNTVLVEYDERDGQAERLQSLDCVKDVKYLGLSKTHEFEANHDSLRHTLLKDSLPELEHAYGAGLVPIRQLNGLPLHEAGFRGRGMTIAVLDGGFFNADIVAPLQGIQVLGTHNFQRPERSVYEENSHGMKVLSCIATDRPHVMVGTAPEAAFWLLVTEDTFNENEAEEDMWAAGVEFADSVGADIVTSSLGYNRFDDESLSHKYYEQDGRTALNSRTASLAASRGLMVVNSAGNEGGGTWKKIGFPGDARDMLTVGAINDEGVNTTFSSLGPTADGRVKPDVVALGFKAPVVMTDGTMGTANGTSFSCPITAGMVACLMQALPRLRPAGIIRLIQQSGHNAAHPDNVFGYGIPDYWKAYLNGKK